MSSNDELAEKLAEARKVFKAGLYLDCAGLLESRLEQACRDELEAAAHLQLARALEKLARYGDSQSHLRLARHYYEQHKKNSSAEYADVLQQIGVVFREQSCHEEARKHLEQALTIREAIDPFGNETAKALQDLGEIFLNQGDYRTALRYFDQALDLQRKCIGEKHEDYADVLADRGLAFLNLSRPNEAEADLTASLKIKEQCLPADHELIGIGLLNLANCLLGQGRKNDVEEMSKRAIDILSRSYGENSPRTAVAVNNLGGFYLESGNLVEAAKCFERAVAIKETVLGKDNLALVNNVRNLAMVYGMLDRKDEAAKLNKRVQQLMVAKIDDSDNKDTDTMIFLADQLHSENKNEQALKVVKQALNTASREHGADSLKAADILNYAASLYLACGDFEKARLHFAQVLRIRKKHLGKKNASVAETLRRIGTCVAAQGLRDLEQILNLQAIAIERECGVEDPQITALRVDLNSARDRFGPNDPKVISKIRFLSEAYRMQGEVEASAQLFEEYCEAQEKAGNGVGLAHDLLVKAMERMPVLAAVSIQQGKSVPVDEDDINEAISLLHRSVRLQETALVDEADQRMLCAALGQLVIAHLLTDNLAEAETIQRRSISLVEAAKGENHWSLAAPLQQLKNILERQGKTDEAEIVEQRSKALPKPSNLDVQEQTREMTERMMSNFSSLLQGLVGAFEGTGLIDQNAPLAMLGAMNTDVAPEAAVPLADLLPADVLAALNLPEFTAAKEDEEA